MFSDKIAQNENKRVSITVLSKITDINSKDEKDAFAKEDDGHNNQSLLHHDRKENYTPRFSVRIVIVGDSKVGKTTMMSALIQDFQNKYRQRTIGADFLRYIISTLSIDIKMFELSGHRAFHSRLCPSLFSKHPDIVCLVCNPENKDTVDSLPTYWAKLLEKNTIGEGCRVQLIGCILKNSVQQQEKYEWRAIASNVAKLLGKKQVDITEINANDRSVVAKFFEEIAEQAACRILHKLIKQLKNNAAGVIQSKLILRKSGFSESFVSKHRLEPLCTLMKDQTNNKNFNAEDFQDNESEDSSSNSTRWLELRGSEIVIFQSVKHARNGFDPLRAIKLSSKCKTQVLAGIVLEVDDGFVRNIFIPNSKEVAEHWSSTVQSIISGKL